MEDELIEAWDWNTGKPSGYAVSRKEAHRNGIPHEGVHLWIVSRIKSIPHILLQHRAKSAETYSGYLDITVGGHVVFGLDEDKIGKEAKEELGIDLKGKKLIDLGYFRYEETIAGLSLFIREFQHIWLLFDNSPLESYSFPDGSVDGIAAVSVPMLKRMLLKGKETPGFYYDGTAAAERTFSKSDMHPLFFTEPMIRYMRFLLKEIDRRMPGETG